jgi:hypothetical protein
MKVRVPCMDQVDSFLTDDLVGAEFIEEDGDDYSVAKKVDDETRCNPCPTKAVNTSVAVVVADEDDDRDTTVEEAVPEPAVVGKTSEAAHENAQRH